MNTPKKQSSLINNSQFPILEKTHEIYRQKQFHLAKPYSDCNPSEITDIYWIYALGKNIVYPNPTKLSGKWLLFVNIEKLDETWKAVKKATEEGKLGDFSKTATSKPSPTATKLNTKVICVYTKDFNEKDDVMRVRRELR